MRILKNCIVQSFLVGIMMMVILLCCSSQVQAAQSGDYTYTVTDGKAEITKYTGAGGDVTVPSTLDEFTVTSIGAHAFDACIAITTISIPQGVTSIGYEAFRGCFDLTTISIPQGVSSIGNKAFSVCIRLTTITVSEDNLNYASINGALFNKVGNMLIACPAGNTAFSIPEGVTSIGNFAFIDCKVTTISIPETVTSIGNEAFSDSRLTTIIIPEGVTSIGRNAFINCNNLTSIRFNSTTTTIFDYELTIPAATKIIGYDQSTARNYATKYGRTFQVIDTSNTLQSIAITTPATKLIYGIGDELDIAGLVISGIYNDGNTTPVAITVANVTGFNSAVEAADQVLTITVGTKTTTYSVQIVNQIPALTYENSTIDTTNKIIILAFSDAVVNNGTNLEELKSAITFASDGLTFDALGANDTVAINGNTLVVTFNTTLAGSINKIKIAANSLKDTAGNVLDTDVITEPIVASVNLGEVVNIPDQSFLAVVRDSLNKPTGDIHYSDMLTLTDLEARDKGISDLTGLEYASNLYNLDIKNNQITNISAIAGLTKLKYLDFGGNQVTDISALINLNKLINLSLWGNHVDSITTFQNKPNIERLHIDNMGINNISVLAGMSKLKSLWASGNEISDLSPLTDMTSMLELQLETNKISDISVLANLTNLQTLNVCKNNLTEISVVAGMPDLKDLDFGGNQVNNIAPLAGLNKLEELKFWGNNVAGGDISVISGKTSIRNLHIDGINASDLSPVSTLSNLELFWANMNQISNLSPLANLNKLNNLSLHNNAITDISVLVNNSGFGEGTNIYLENNPLSNQAKVDIQTLRNRGVNVSYDLPETIAGCVQTPNDDSFIPSNNSNVYVKIRRLNNSGDDLAGSSINSDGTYSLKGDIPTGDYSLRADAKGSNNPYANAIPVKVHLVAGQTISQDISLTSPFISGKVLKPDGSVFAPGNDSYVFVKLRGQNGGEDICDTGVNNDGSFRLGGDIPTGDYLLMADAKGSNNPYSNAIYVTVHLVTGQTTTQDISLTIPMITGKILKPDGNPFVPGNDSNGRVVLGDANGKEITDTNIKDDGTYKLGGVIQSGQYKLWVDIWGNNNPYCRPTPLTITVTLGTVLTQDITLTNPIITGRVLKPDGSVFTPGNDSNVYVKLRKQDNSGDDLCGSGVNNDGSFKLGGNIPEGSYLLVADACGSANPYASAIPVIIHVPTGGILEQNISLTNPLITGRVLKPDGSVFVPGNDSNVYVKLRRQDDSGDDICGTGVNDDGSFRLGGDILTGDYLLMADANGSNNQYADAIPVIVHVTAGQTTSKDISLTNPIIKGRILKPDGSPFLRGNGSDGRVVLRDINGNEITDSNIEDNGTYKLGGGIQSGQYQLCADVWGNNNPYSRPIPLTITITLGTVLTQDITLTNPLITGKVLKPDGSVFTPGNDSYVYVKLRRQDNSGGDLCGTGISNDGSFKLGGDIPTGDYLLMADANGINNQYTDAIPVIVHVTAGQTTSKDISLTNPIIIGRILKPDGYPFLPWNYSNVYVVLRRQDNSGDDLCGTGVNDDGSFRLGGDIPTGDYLLMAYANGSNNPYANAITVNVHLVAGQTTPQDISLTAPIIIGSVLNPDGSVFTPRNDSNVYVKLTRPDNTGVDLCGTSVNDDGSFKLGGVIPTGDYLLMADANGINNPYANSIPLTVHITLGQSLTQNISLTNPVVTGKIFKPGGDAYIPGQDSWVVVCLRSSNGWEKWTGVYGDGLFRFGGDIPAGDYTLHTYPQGRNNTYSNSIPKTITVVSDQHKAYDLTLTNPKITGKVFMPNGSVFTPGSDSNVHVKLRRPDNTGDDLCDAFLNDDGSFRLGGDIPPGDYLLRADVRGSNNLYANAIPLTVQITAGQLLTQNISLTILNYSATPLIQIGINPDVGGSAGIYVGLKDIKDTQSNVVPNVKLAGYQIEVDYDPTKVAILDVSDEAHLGQFIYSVEIDLVAGKGKVLVADAGANGTTNSSKLFFLPINLKGSALDLSSLQVKYLSVSDVNLRQIKIDPVDLEFHRGKIYNEGSAIQPNISDAVAGLQFLAGLIDVGTNLEQVNPINMASIVGPDPDDSTIVKPNVKDVIALMQYLVGLRDINFNNSGDILIGGNLELTGDLSIFGKPAKNAIELAFQQVNDQGGILNGRKFKLIAQDNKSVDNEVVTAATKLIEQAKVVGIIGPLTTVGTRAEIHVATENSVPVITPSGSAPILTVNENGQLNQWIFRACFIDPVQAKAAAKFALGLKISAETTAAIISDQNDGYSQALAAAFGQSFTNGGGEIVDQELQEHYSDGSDNYSTILAKIKLAEPDVVYLPGYYQEAGKIIKRARELGMNMPFIGGDGWANPDIYNIAGVQAMNNTYYTDHVALDDPAMAQFITDYQAKYGEMPDAWPALAFDAAKMFIKAIELAGSTDTEKIRVALENLTDLQGVCGNITVDPLTHNPVRNVVVMENKEGKAVFLAKIVPN